MLAHLKIKCPPYHITGGYLERSYPEGEAAQTIAVTAGICKTKEQINSTVAAAAGGPWLIHAGKLVSAHRAQRPPPLQRVGILCERWVAAAAAKGVGGPLRLVGEPLMMIYRHFLLYFIILE